MLTNNKKIAIYLSQDLNNLYEHCRPRLAATVEATTPAVIYPHTEEVSPPGACQV